MLNKFLYIIFLIFLASLNLSAMEEDAFEKMLRNAEVFYSRDALEQNYHEAQEKLFNSMTSFIDLTNTYYQLTEEDKNHDWTYANTLVSVDEHNIVDRTKKYLYLPQYEEGSNIYKRITILTFNDPSEIPESLDIKGASYTLGENLIEIERQRNMVRLLALRNVMIWWRRYLFPTSMSDGYNYVKGEVFRSGVRLVKCLFLKEQLQNSKDLLIQQPTNIYQSIKIALKDIIKSIPHKDVFVSFNRLQSDPTSLGRMKKVLEAKKRHFEEAIYKPRNDQLNIILRIFKAVDRFDKTYTKILKDLSFVRPNLKAMELNLKVWLAEFKDSQNFPLSGNKRLRLRIMPPLSTIAELTCDHVSDLRKIEADASLLEKIIANLALPHGQPLRGELLDEMLARLMQESQREENEVKRELLEKEPEQAVGIVVDNETNILFPQENGESSPVEEESLKEEDLRVEESIIYCDDYFRAEHLRHQELKKLHHSQVQENDKSQQGYEQRLLTYLENNIFHANHKLTTNNLKKQLRRLRFKIVANKHGKGSLCYVMPMADNPLFGSHPVYKEAYFNLHLPSDKSLQLPFGYFRYLQSGFRNIFGINIKDNTVGEE